MYVFFVFYDCNFPLMFGITKWHVAICMEINVIFPTNL